MNKFLFFFKTTSPLILILICVVIGIIAKLIEKKIPDLAMGLQTLTFLLFIFAFIKFLNTKFK